MLRTGNSSKWRNRVNFGSLQGVDGAGLLRPEGRNRCLQIGPVSSVTARSTSSPPAVLDLPLFPTHRRPVATHGASLLHCRNALRNPDAGVVRKKLDQPLAPRLGRTSLRRERVHLPSGPDQTCRHPHCGKHALAERHPRRAWTAHGVAFSAAQVPTLRFAVDEKTGPCSQTCQPGCCRAAPPVREKSNRTKLVPLFGERTDADVVRLDVAVDDATAFEVSHRRQKNRRHTWPASPGWETPSVRSWAVERLVAGLLQDKDRPVVHDEFFFDGKR